MKRIVASALALVLCSAGFAGCGEEEPFSGFVDPAREYAERSVSLNDAVREKYWQEAVLFMYHYYPNFTTDASGDMSTAFVWPYTETVAASWRIATLSDGAKTEVGEYYKKLLEGFEYYRSFRSDYHVYCASRATEIGMAAGDTYYDDNVWISREFLNAYEVFGDDEYLDTSAKVATFVWSGWANDELGGIYWCEQKKNSRNTCSNAPASLLFARLYQATGEKEWLERAEQVYEWTYNTLRDPSDNVYWDNISNESDITTWKFTYNTGSMIGAGVKLHEVMLQEAEKTSDETEKAALLQKAEIYLSQAKASAEGAYQYWFKQREGYDYRVIDSTNPWFNVLLLDAWVELYRFAPETTLPYIEAYEANLNHAYTFLHDGLMPADWVNGWGKDGEGNPVISKANVLDMAANAENFGTLAYFYQYIKEENE